MKLYFIGGASGSGKSAVIPYLKDLLGKDIKIYDFDDTKVPDNADKKWRQEATEQWLQKLLKNNNNAICLGQIVLGEIMACPSVKYLDKINFCLLDVKDSKRVERLKNLNGGADQNILNWSSWLRMHHSNTGWMPQMITCNATKLMDFSYLENLNSWNNKANVTIIDTSNLCLESLAYKISNWINSLESNTEKILTSSLNLSYKISVATTKEAEKLLANLIGFNMQELSLTSNNDQPLNYVIKDKNKDVIAGITGYFYFSECLYIDVLFVDKHKRNKRLGSYLLETIEEKAKLLGATIAHLSTFDFQAKDFYLKHGYQVFSVLKDCPRGHKSYYMKKIL